MPAKNSRVNVYRAERAAQVLGMSTRQLLRYAEKMKKQRAAMGSQLVYLFTDAELNWIREMQIKKANSDDFAARLVRSIFAGTGKNT